jgi:hypothetical protein
MKIFLRYSLYVLLAFFLMAGGLVAYLLANKDQIKAYALEQVNSQLNTELKVSSFDITLLSQFPKVSLDMVGVSIEDPLHPDQFLLKAGHVFAGFNLYDILRKNYTIKLIAIDDAELNLITDKKGRSNYMILKESEKDREENEAFLLNLKEVKLANVKLDYRDDKYKQYYDLVLNKVMLAGDFNSNGERIVLEGKVMANKIRSQEFTIVKNKKLALDLVLKMDHKTNTYVFEKGDVDIDRLKLALKGSIVNKPKSVVFDLKAGARNLDIPGLLSLLPNQGGLPDDLESDGELFFEGTIKGEADNKQSPAIRFAFGIKNGKLQRGNGPAITSINAEGEFSNGSSRNRKSSYVNLSPLNFIINNGKVSGSLSVTNFTDPELKTQLKGNINAADLLAFLKNETIKNAEGTITFDVDFSGKIAHMNTAGWLKNKANGNLNINLSNISFTQNNKTIKTLKVDLSLANKDAVINLFIAEIDQSDIKVTGKIVNLIPYLLVDGQSLQAEITYQSNYIDLGNFMMPLSPANMDPNQKGFALPANVVIDAHVRAQEVVYNTFRAKNVTTDLRWKGKQIMVENLSAHTMDGQLKLDGQVENAPDGRFLVSASTELTNINIQSLFKSCNNFGQQEITHQHLKGTLNGTVDVVSVWSNNLDCDLNKLYALGKLKIAKGELNGYKPIEVLAKYADINELRNLKFADLSNTIEIRNRTIYIPAFEVRNSALNLTMSGTHTFDNYIDYRIKLKLSEVLRKNRKPSTNEFNEEETSDGGVNIYLSMKGPIDNYKISYDKIGLKQQVKQDIKKEQKNIKEILKKELGLDKEDKQEIKEKKDDSEELEFEAE